MATEVNQYPEGGYGWFIIGASFFIHFVFHGLPFNFGIFLNYYNVSFNDSTNTLLLTSAGSIGLALATICGFITGRLADKFGYRNMALLGSLIFVLGYFLSSFSNQAWQIFILQGIMVGIGGSIGFFPAISAPSHYFLKRRGFMTGICVSGSGIGGMVFTLISRPSLESFGLAWTLRLVALIALILTIPSALILRERISPSPRPHLIDFSLFKNIQFTTLWIGGLICNLGFLVPLYTLPSYAVKHNLTSNQGAILVAILNAGNAVGRILLGFLADHCNVLDIMICGIMLSGLLSIFIWFFATTFPTLILFCIVYGLSYGSYISLLSVVSSKLFGVKNIASTNGLLFVSFGISIFIGNFIATLLLKFGFSAVILFSGISTVTGSLIILSLNYQIYRQKSLSLPSANLK